MLNARYLKVLGERSASNLISHVTRFEKFSAVEDGGSIKPRAKSEGRARGSATQHKFKPVKRAAARQAQGLSLSSIALNG